MSLQARPLYSPRRVRFILLLLILWDVFALIAELSFGSALFKIDGGNIEGIIGSRGSFSGAALVTLLLYVYAIVRGPERHPGIFWLAAVEQGATALFAVYHVARDDVEVSAVIMPIIVSLALLALILLHMPRGQTSS